VALHLSDGLRRLVDAAEVYYLEAVDDGTLVRLRARRTLTDVRKLGEVLSRFEPHGFVRIHREYAVNLRHVRELRRRSEGRDWEVKLESPVHRVLPVSRSALDDLTAAVG